MKSDSTRPRVGAVLVAGLLAVSLATLSCGADGGGGDDLPVPPGAVVFASDRTGNWELFRVGLDDTGLEQLTDSPGDDIMPAVSPDGRTVALTSTREPGRGIYLLDLASRAVTPLVADLLSPNSACFAPDGETVYFEAALGPGEGYDLFRVATSGGDPEQLTAGGGNDAAPVVSPDGQTVYFVSSRDGSFEIWRMDPDGGDQRVVTDGAGILGGPKIAPDGGSLVYTVTDPRSGDFTLTRLDLATGAPELLGPQKATEACFCPDGEHLVFRTQESSVDPEIVLYDLVRRRIVRTLAADPALDGSPACLTADENS